MVAVSKESYVAICRQNVPPGPSLANLTGKKMLETVKKSTLVAEATIERPSLNLSQLDGSILLTSDYVYMAIF